MRAFAFALALPAAAVLTGCPVLFEPVPSDGVCYDEWGNTYVGYGDDDIDYGDGYAYGDCLPPSTSDGSCRHNGQCWDGSYCGRDQRCHTGTCADLGCSAGYECVIRGGEAQCVVEGSVPPDACHRNADCGAGRACLNGQCVDSGSQCVDSTQCAAGLRCADGVCTATCGAVGECPVGYACDLDRGLCTDNPTECSANQPCGSGTVCVGDRCVAECVDNTQCPSGLVCRLGGCVVDEAPSQLCAVTGELGDGTPGRCASGSLCVRGSCYIACDAQDADACRTADEFNVCKSVSVAEHSYGVCGSNDNLGDECDTASGRACADASKICLDGYCR